MDTLMALRLGRPDLANGKPANTVAPDVQKTPVSASFDVGVGVGESRAEIEGRIGLGIVIAMVVGVAAFYYVTRGGQF